VLYVVIIVSYGDYTLSAYVNHVTVTIGVLCYHSFTSNCQNGQLFKLCLLNLIVICFVFFVCCEFCFGDSGSHVRVVSC